MRVFCADRSHLKQIISIFGAGTCKQPLQQALQSVNNEIEVARQRCDHFQAMVDWCIERLRGQYRAEECQYMVEQWFLNDPDLSAAYERVKDLESKQGLLQAVLESL